MNNQLINQFAKTIEKFVPDVIPKLNPPLAFDQANALLEQIGIMDFHLASLYSWKNGLPRNFPGNQSYFEMGWHHPIQKVVNKVQEGNMEEDHLVPFISDESGDYLVFNRAKGADYGKIYIISVALLSFFDDPYYVFSSVKSLLQTTIEAYNTGGLFLGPNEGDWLQEDQQLYRKAARKYNPDCAFWKS